MKVVLIVEDESEQSKLLQIRLEANGFGTIIAKNGQEALKEAESGRPDLVIVDLLLPDMNGFEVCQRLKEAPETRQIPVVMLTAYPVEDVERRCLESGASLCLRKPYVASELLAEIKRLLKKV